MATKHLTINKKIEVGKEATNAWGTAVAPTQKMMGVTDVSITPLVTVEQIKDMRGDYNPSRESLVRQVGGEATVEGWMSYEQSPYVFDAFFWHTDSDVGMTTDASGDATRVYYSPTHASDVKDTRVQTIVHGDVGVSSDVINVINLAGATMKGLELTGEIGSPLTYRANYIGKQVSTDTFANVADTDVDYVLGGHLNLLYIDPGSDGIGNTKTSDIMFSFNLSLDNGREIDRHMGDFAPKGYKDNPFSGTLNLVLELTSVSEPYLDAIISATDKGVEKNVRMKFLSDSDYIQIDFCGVVVDAPDLYTDVDGVMTADFTLTGQKTSGTSDWLGVTLFNHVPSLT